MKTIILPGKPIPYKAPRVYSSATFNPRYQEKRYIQQEILNQYDGQLISGPIAISYIFNFSVPVSFSKKKTLEALNGTIYHTTRSDISNLLKFYDDCLIDTVIEDDSQIVDCKAIKKYASKEGVIITLIPLQG